MFTLKDLAAQLSSSLYQAMPNNILDSHPHPPQIQANKNGVEGLSKKTFHSDFYLLKKEKKMFEKG